MCNFYTMFYVDGNKLPDDDVCYTAGPPQFNWAMLDDPPLDLSKVPSNVSVIPGTKQVLMQSQVSVFLI